MQLILQYPAHPALLQYIHKCILLYVQYTVYFKNSKSNIQCSMILRTQPRI